MIYRYKGSDVYYKSQGTGPALLILHGWGCDSSEFDSFLDLLSGSYRVIALDFPGFGHSTEPESVWGVEEYTCMLESFVKDNDIDSPALIGHSFGGRVAILYSSRNSVKSVVLADSAGVKPRRSLRYYIKVYSFKFMRRMAELFMGKDKAKVWLDARRGKTGSADYRNASPKMRAVLSKVVNEDLRSHMKHIKAPVLLFWGELDTATPLSDARQMEKLIPDAGLVTVPGAGHFSFLENPALFRAVLKSFLKIK